MVWFCCSLLLIEVHGLSIFIASDKSVTMSDFISRIGVSVLKGAV